MRTRHVWALFVAVAAISGCMVGPDYKAPNPAVPDQWSEPLEGGTSVSAPAPEEWWPVFDDETLNSLIERAAAGSYDLRIAEARLREVRTYEDITGAALWPQVNANATYQHSQTQKIETPEARKSSASVTLTPNGLAGVSITRSPFGSAGPSFTSVPDLTGEGNSTLTIRSGSGVNAKVPDRQNDLYRAGFDATWELDLFGGIRRELEASRADTESTEEVRRDVFITVAAEVARNYFMLRSAQNRLEIANKNIDAQARSLDLAQSRFERGLTGELDVKFAEAALAFSRSSVPSLEASIQWAIHRLGVLIGSAPGALQDELSATAPLAKTPPEVPVGLPVDIIRRRPDVRGAERAIAAATARIGAAKADLYPHFVLTGSLTGSSGKFDGITRGANTLWSFGPGIRWPVFDGGRIRANIRVQDARQEQTIAAYEQTVLLALEEVENALVAYAKEQNRLVSLREAVEANRRALEIANQLYGKGLVSFINVLDAERSLFANEDLLTQSETVVLTNLVALYKALGGGWESFYPEQSGPEQTSATEAQPPAA